MKYIISISGGKDSTACLLYMLERVPKENILPIFIDTKWEHELVYKYLNYLENELDLKIKRIESLGMFELCKKYKFMPNRVMRFCTRELKIKPFLNWLYENFISKNLDFIIVEGIRRNESLSRSDTEVFDIQKVKINSNFYYLKKLYPVAYWSEERVFEFIKSKNLDLNPLYLKGFKRVGCYPCIFETKQSLKLIADDDFYVKRLRNLENEVSKLRGENVTFFHSSLNSVLHQKSLFAKTPTPEERP